MKVTQKIKIALVLAVSAFFSNNIQAQDTMSTQNYDQGFRLGVGVTAGYATNDPYKLALSGDVRLQYDLTKRYSLTLTTGYTNLFASEPVSDLGFIPAKAGFKAFVWNDQFYVMGEAGAAFAVSNGNHDQSLLLAPSIGYATKYVDISVRYEHYNHFERQNGNEGLGQIGVRLAYGFKL